MTVQTLTMGKRKFVVIPEGDYRRLQQRAQISGQRTASVASAEDRRDATVLQKRLAEMRRRGEKPIPYVQARKQMGLA